MTEQDKVKTVLAFYQVSNQLKNIMIDSGRNTVIGSWLLLCPRELRILLRY